MWNDLLATVGPSLITLAGLVVTAGVALATNYVRKNWLNNVAQSAFANAAGGIVNQLGEEILKNVMTTGHAEVQQATDKVIKRIPDVVRSLGLTPQGIAERIVDNLGKLQAPAIGALMPRAVVQVAPNPNQPGMSPAPGMNKPS